MVRESIVVGRLAVAACGAAAICVLLSRWPIRRKAVCKRSGSSSVRGEQVVCTNHPLATSAGLEMLACGGNAVDAGIAALFTLCVVEPMMVGLCGGGVAVMRLADGELLTVDAIASAGSMARPQNVAPAHPDVELTSPLYYKFAGANATIGAKAACTPGSLAAWCHLLQAHGTLPLPVVLRTAIAHAEDGFRVSSYLHKYLREYAKSLQGEARAIFLLPDGRPLPVGTTLTQPALAETLRLVASQGAAVLHSAEGRLAQAIVGMSGVHISLDDLCAYRPHLSAPLVGTYRGWKVVSPPLGASGAFLIEVLHVLEKFDVRALGVGSADAVDLLAQALTLVSADRAALASDPVATNASAQPLLTDAHAQRLAECIRVPRRPEAVPTATVDVGGGNEGDDEGVAGRRFEAPQHTTHVAVADRSGLTIAITQTLNDAFGACVMAPGTGALLNNGMALFEPRAGRPNSVAPGKRPASSHAPTLLLDPSGRLALNVGKIGGMRIWPSVAQVIVNIVDHGMGVQAALDAPLVWTRGGVLELERDHRPSLDAELQSRGYRVHMRDAIGGGGSAIMASACEQEASGGRTRHHMGRHAACDPHRTDPASAFEGACCWRADGYAAALAGRHARDVEPHY